MSWKSAQWRASCRVLPDGQTDGRTYRQTDRQTERQEDGKSPYTQFYESA